MLALSQQVIREVRPKPIHGNESPGWGGKKFTVNSSHSFIQTVGQIKIQPIVLGYFNFRNNPVDSDESSVKPLSIGLILTNSSLTRVQQAKEIKTIGSLFCCSSCRLLFSMAIGLPSCSCFPPVVKVHNSNSKYKYWYLLLL